MFMERAGLIRILAASLGALMLAGCATTADKINDLVDDTIKNSKELTQEEWAARDKKLQEYLKEFQENRDAYTEEERESVDYALGKYYGEQIKLGIRQAKEGLEDFMERIPGFIDGFVEGLGGSDADEAPTDTSDQPDASEGQPDANAPEQSTGSGKTI